MIAYAKREFRSVMLGGVGPLVTGFICAVLFLYLIFNNLIGLSTETGAVMNATSVLGLTFAVPVLTMRTFAEEKRMRTDLLYLTAPLPLRDVVLGKFLAVAGVLLIPTLIAAALPILLTPFGHVSYLTSYTAVICFYLYALMLAAVGMFLSAMTDNPAVAAVLSFAVIMMGVLLGNAYDSIALIPLRRALKGLFDLSGHLNRVMYGSLDFGAVVYFVSVCLLFLYLTVWALGRGQRKRSRLPLVLFSVLTVALNLVISAIPDHMRSADVSGALLYSISEASKKTVSGITEPVTIHFIASDADTDERRDPDIERILKLYDSGSDNITLSYADPDLNPRFYEAYSETELPLNSVVVVNEATGKYRSIGVDKLRLSAFDGSLLSSYTTGYDTEGQVTAALTYVTTKDTEAKTILILTGHGETPIDETFADLLTRSGAKTDEATHVTEEMLGKNNPSMLLMNCPVTDLSAYEERAVSDYLEGGGNLLLIARFDADEKPMLGNVLAGFGIAEKQGIVVETAQDMFFYSGDTMMPYYLFPKVKEDVLTRDTDAGGQIFVPVSEAFEIKEDAEDVTITPLLTTSEIAYFHDDPDVEPNLAQRESDETGPFIVGIRAEKGGTIVAYGSAEMFTADADSLANGMNVRLFGNTVNSMLSDGEGFETIPVKRLDERLHITAAQMIPLSVVLVALVPLIWIAGGIVWWRRRRA